ncbi:MAG TPA: hypothetical protein VEW95_08090 [Candidatus Limnocylindrales bacterium]|nr:hypothetical protein [Candidatus Limnocylindrales bacterium]
MIGYVMTAAAHNGRGLATAVTTLTLASLRAAWRTAGDKSGLGRT